MGEAAMMGKVIDRTFESPKYVEIRCFGSQRHRRGGKSGFPVKSGTAQNSPGQEMGDGFQTFFVAQNDPFTRVRRGVRSSFALFGRLLWLIAYRNREG